MKTNTVCWIFLILLTLAGVMISDVDQSAKAGALIMSAALIKSTLVGWRFMELHSAHALWRASFVAMVGGIVGLLYCLG